MNQTPDDPLGQRLRYRSWHRGTREMDLLMGSFADRYLADFTPDELNQYAAILQLSDPDLYSWICGSQPLPPEQDNPVMRRLCAHRFAGS